LKDYVEQGRISAEAGLVIPREGVESSEGEERRRSSGFMPVIPREGVERKTQTSKGMTPQEFGDPERGS